MHSHISPSGLEGLTEPQVVEMVKGKLVRMEGRGKGVESRNCSSGAHVALRFGELAGKLKVDIGFIRRMRYGHRVLTVFFAVLVLGYQGDR